MDMKQEYDMLDLSHILLAEYSIARFVTKAQAKAWAKSRGWYQCDVIEACNRDNVFWVVGEHCPDSMLLSTETRGYVDIPYCCLEAKDS